MVSFIASNIINPAVFHPGFINAAQDVPPPAESRRKPAKRQLVAHLRQRFAGDDEIDQDDLFRRRVNN